MNILRIYTPAYKLAYSYAFLFLWYGKRLWNTFTKCFEGKVISKDYLILVMVSNYSVESALTRQRIEPEPELEPEQEQERERERVPEPPQREQSEQSSSASHP